MNLHFIPKQFGFQTYLNRIVLFQGIVIKLKQENIHKTLDWQKYAGGAIYTGFYLYFFFYIMQQEPRREATENNGTLFSLVRKRLGRDRVLVAKEKK